MKYTKFLIFLWLIPLVIFISRGGGPDCGVYRKVAEKIIEEGHLNILGSFVGGHPREVSPTFHHPIFQAIGGSVFFIPPRIMAPVSLYLSSFFPPAPPRCQSLFYHQSVWEGFIAWLLGFWACLLVYRVARIHYSARASATAIVLCALGGPILIFVARWPAQANLPTALLAALLLYIYHFTDRRKYLAWFLMGAVWGFGVFIRNEFVVWFLLPAYGIIMQIRSGERWRVTGVQCLLFTLPSGCFLVSIFLIQIILFGSWGNTYSILIDPRLLAEMPRMLFGPRNGLFAFWPVLFLALIGYIIKFRANPGVNHLMFCIILSAIAVCTVFPFWLAVGGQRPMLIAMPCFMLFLARLLDEKRRFYWIFLIIGIGSVLWAMLIFFTYGKGWKQPDGSIGFLKPDTLPEMFIFVAGRAKAFFPGVTRFLFFPKLRIIGRFLPFIIPIFLLIVFLQKIIPRRRALLLLAVLLSILCMVILIFLIGAEGRGREFYQSIAQSQPEGWFVYNSRYHIGEYFINSLDFVAYYLENNQPDTAMFFEERAVIFLRKAAPRFIREFRLICEVFRIRKYLGWKRLFPVGLAEDPVLWLQWYYSKNENSPELKMFPSFFSEIRYSENDENVPSLESYNFRSDFKDIINNYRTPGELLQR